nr:hypothetical protein [Tanacetum cinerariifolium]
MKTSNTPFSKSEDSKPTRKDTQVPQPSGPTESIADEAAHKELGDSLVRAATTASSLEAEHDSGGLRCQETIWDTIAQTRFESVSKHSNYSLLIRGNTLQSDEDSLKLDELMALCTTLQNKVFDLEKTMTTQHNETASLKKRVRKLEKKNKSRTHRLKRLYQVGLTARVESSGNEESLSEDASKQARRINAIDADEDITLVSAAYNEMFDVDVLGGEEVFVAGQNKNVVEEVIDVAQFITTATTVTITTEEITLAQALETLKTFKTQDERDCFSRSRLDEKAAKKLQAKFNEEERLAREKAEKEKRANIALIEEWDDIQTKIDADIQLAERLQAQKQEELSDAEKATLFQQLLEKRRKHFAAKEAFKRVNTFENFRIKLVKGKEKSAREELVQEITKKKKVEDDKEKAEPKQLMKTIPYEEEVAINAIPLAVKSPRIVDFYADLHVGREEISYYTTYTFNDAEKEAYN